MRPLGNLTCLLALPLFACSQADPEPAPAPPPEERVTAPPLVPARPLLASYSGRWCPQGRDRPRFALEDDGQIVRGTVDTAGPERIELDLARGEHALTGTCRVTGPAGAALESPVELRPAPGGGLWGRLPAVWVDDDGSLITWDEGSLRWDPEPPASAGPTPPPDPPPPPDSPPPPPPGNAAPPIDPLERERADEERRLRLEKARLVAELRERRATPEGLAGLMLEALQASDLDRLWKCVVDNDDGVHLFGPEARDQVSLAHSSYRAWRDALPPLDGAGVARFEGEPEQGKVAREVPQAVLVLEREGETIRLRLGRLVQVEDGSWKALRAEAE